MNITTIGVDLAKIVFQVHGVDARGKTVLRKQLKRAEVMGFFAQLPPCLVGMEACGSAHFWARKLSELGHTVKLMAPQFVKPYVKSNKNDARMRRRSARRWPAEHALCTDQERRTAGAARAASSAPGICHRAHRASQSDARTTDRVWDGDAGGYPLHRA